MTTVLSSVDSYLLKNRKVKRRTYRWIASSKEAKPRLCYLLPSPTKDYYFTKSWTDRYVYIMMTSSNGNIFRVTGPLCGEFTGPGEFPTQRPVTRSFDVSFDLRLNKRLSEQPWGWWFETLSWSLWRQCNVNTSNTNSFPFWQNRMQFYVCLFNQKGKYCLIKELKYRYKR